MLRRLLEEIDAGLTEGDDVGEGLSNNQPDDGGDGDSSNEKERRRTGSTTPPGSLARL